MKRSDRATRGSEYPRCRGCPLELRCLFLSCGEIKRSGRSHRVALSVPALNVARNWIRAPDYIVALSRPRENRVITRMQNWCPIERTRILMRRGFPSHEDYQQRFWESTKGSYPQF